MCLVLMFVVAFSFSDVSLVNVRERKEGVSTTGSLLCLIICKESIELAISSLYLGRVKAIMEE